MRRIDIPGGRMTKAQEQLAQHLAKYPGDYWECHRNGTLDYRREWLLRRDVLEAMAQINPDPQPAKKRKSKAKPPSHWIAATESLIRRMGETPHRSEEWMALRNSAEGCIKLAANAARNLGMPKPTAPKLPSMIPSRNAA